MTALVETKGMQQGNNPGFLPATIKARPANG
jgi:hypothetical protein